MKRGHVHFAVGIPEGKVKGAAQDEAPKAVLMPVEDHKNNEEEEKEVKVKSGMRLDAQVLVYIDVSRALQAPDEATRLKWWKSANNVILSEGDANGIVSIEWFSKIIDRKAGNIVIWEQDSSVTDGKGVKEVLGEWKKDESASKGARGGRDGRGGGGERGRESAR